MEQLSFLINCARRLNAMGAVEAASNAMQAQLKLEDECISKSIEYARQFLA